MSRLSLQYKRFWNNEDNFVPSQHYIIWSRKRTSSRKLKRGVLTHFDIRMYNKGPKWFKKMVHIRPHRRNTKLALTKVSHKDSIYDIEFPLHKKPVTYWW